MDPNAVLDDAAPRVAETTPELLSLLDDMVRTYRPTVRRRGRLAVTGGALGATVVLGFAGAAAAAAVMHYTNANVPDSTESSSFTWTSSAGNTCTVTVQAGPRPDSDPNYSTSQGDALSAVHEWMGSFDVAAVDIAQAEKTWLQSMHRSQADHPSTAGLSRRFTGDELERYAVTDAATRALSDYLASRGFALRSLNTGVGAECGG